MLFLMLPGLALAATPMPAGMDDTFSSGEGFPPVSYNALLSDGTITGRTGRLLVRGDAAIVSTFPGVGRVTTLAGGLLRVEPSAGMDDLALARALEARQGITYAFPDLTFALVPANMPDDPWVGDQWHLENTGQGGRVVDVDIDAEIAWNYATGAGQVIAIIDSGVQLDHPDLSVIAGYDYISRDTDPSPDGSSSGPHGTGAAGVAAAVGNNGYGVAGVAYDADVYAIRLIGGETSMQDLYDSFSEAVDAGATVLSNSWGFGTDCPTIPGDSVFGDMFDYAENNGRGGLGSAVVFAAGNGACDIVNDGMLRNDKVIVVAAVEWNDERAWYSSFGDSVDISAPTSLLTTDMVDGGYGSYGGDSAFSDGYSGTSASTPVVSGVVALMFEANPRLTAKQAREVLCETAVRNDAGLADWDSNGRSPYYGCGRIDAGAAVAAVANGAPEAPSPRLVADTAELPRVLLAWDPAVDVDDDALSYEVTWSVNDGTLLVQVVSGTVLDIAAHVVEGDVVTWSVAAVDPWGIGPSSAPVSFTVVAAERVSDVPATTCGGAGSAGWAFLPVLAGLLARRRRG